VDKHFLFISVPLEQVYGFDSIHVVVRISTFRIMRIVETSLSDSV